MVVENLRIEPALHHLSSWRVEIHYLRDKGGTLVHTNRAVSLPVMKLRERRWGEQ